MMQSVKYKWAIAYAVCVVIAGAFAQSQPPAPKTIDQAFKNIQVLKGVPADQLNPAMGFIAASLGVGCDHCHVAGAFDKDDKKPKVVARQMMKLMFAINKDNFEGKPVVTCYSCHRGSQEPVAVPIVAEEEVKPEKPPAALEVTADQILDKYVQAIGGADAIRRILSRVQKGNATTFGGHAFPVEVFEKGPDKRATYLHTPPGDSATVYDGHGGWMTMPGRPSREMSGGDLDSAKFDADLQFPLTIRQTFTELKVRGAEKVGEHDTFVVMGNRADLPPVNFYFDQETSLLVRELRYTETPLGRFPTQIDYSDYRVSGGTRIPFQWSVARPGSRFVTRIEEVQNNVPINDSKFNKPAESTPSPSHP